MENLTQTPEQNLPMKPVDNLEWLACHELIGQTSNGQEVIPAEAIPGFVSLAKLGNSRAVALLQERIETSPWTMPALDAAVGLAEATSNPQMLDIALDISDRIAASGQYDGAKYRRMAADNSDTARRKIAQSAVHLGVEEKLASDAQDWKNESVKNQMLKSIKDAQENNPGPVFKDPQLDEEVAKKSQDIVASLTENNIDEISAAVEELDDSFARSYTFSLMAKKLESAS